MKSGGEHGANREREWEEEGGKRGHVVTTCTPIPKGLRGVAVFGGAPPLLAPTEYTVHGACNVPLSGDPSTITPNVPDRTRTHVHGARARTHARTQVHQVAGVCPMICSGTIMPQLPGTLTHPLLLLPPLTAVLPPLNGCLHKHKRSQPRQTRRESVKHAAVRLPSRPLAAGVATRSNVFRWKTRVHGEPVRRDSRSRHRDGVAVSLLARIRGGICLIFNRERRMEKYINSRVVFGFRRLSRITLEYYKLFILDS